MLKRILPFMLTLSAGIALGSAVSFVGFDRSVLMPLSSLPSLPPSLQRSSACSSYRYRHLQRASPLSVPRPETMRLADEDIYNSREVTRKARIVSKPEPQYTEEARRGNVSGTVVLDAVLASTGEVANIETRQGLPYGLTDAAIAAAQQITFEPARKDGRPVSQRVRVDYNFNLY